MTPPRLLAFLLVTFVLAAAIYAVVGLTLGGDDDPGASEVAAVESAPATPEPGTPSPTGTPHPPVDDGDGCAPRVDASFMSANQIVSYYGNPYAEQLGILGRYEPEELATLLKEHASRLDSLNGFRGVQPAFHIVYETAQPEPGDDGLYLQYVDDATMQEYFALACENHFLVFLDLQIGRSDVETEVRKVLPYLRGSNVHIAIDPEFTMGPDQVPGQAIGHVEASQINAAQRVLDEFVEENDLPDKILIVHQFDGPMIADAENIASFAHVRVVIDMDGFGPPEAKVKKFGWYAEPAQHSGIKIFFEQDDPVMTDEDVQALNPDVIIFQ